MSKLLECAELINGRADQVNRDYVEAAQLLARFVSDLAASLTPEVVSAADRLGKGYGTDIRDLDQQRIDCIKSAQFAMPLISKLREGT